jgi:hypothetical protein
MDGKGGQYVGIGDRWLGPRQGHLKRSGYFFSKKVEEFGREMITICLKAVLDLSRNAGNFEASLTE